jgi:hypothetical protein
LQQGAAPWLPNTAFGRAAKKAAETVPSNQVKPIDLSYRSIYIIHLKEAVLASLRTEQISPMSPAFQRRVCPLWGSCGPFDGTSFNTELQKLAFFAYF